MCTIYIYNLVPTTETSYKISISDCKAMMLAGYAVSREGAVLVINGLATLAAF